MNSAARIQMLKKVKPVVARRIEEWRLRLGLTQAELGEKIGLRDASISRYENPDLLSNLPRLTELAALADLFKVPLESLLSENPLPFPRPRTKKRDRVASLCQKCKHAI